MYDCLMFVVDCIFELYICGLEVILCLNDYNFDFKIYSKMV